MDEYRKRVKTAKKSRISTACTGTVVRERCRELINATDEIARRLYNVIDWMFEHPEYNPKIKVIPKKDYPVLVDVTF